MSEQEAQSALLAELEESLEDDDILGLYVFSWSLSEAEGLTEAARQRVYRAVYTELNRRHRLRLVWLPWPTDRSQAEDADGDTPLDFDLDPDAPPPGRFLALMPAESAISE